MKTIYKNTLGEEVKIKEDQGYCVVNIKDQDNSESEICIPKENAIEIGYSLINELQFNNKNNYQLKMLIELGMLALEDSELCVRSFHALRDKIKHE